MHERFLQNHAEFKASESAFGNLFTAMVESGIPDHIVSRIVSHERLHYLADPFRDGYTGFYRTTDRIVGYYQPLRVDQMTPRERKGMVDIVGGEASGPDKDFWSAAHGDQLKEEREANIIASMIISSIDRLSTEFEEIPSFEKLVGYESEYMVENYGDFFRRVYEDVCDKAKQNIDDEDSEMAEGFDVEQHDTYIRNNSSTIFSKN